MHRALVMTLAIAALLTAAPPAQAKIAGTASISGPGIGGPGSGTGDDQAIRMDGADYPFLAGLYVGVDGSKQPPTDALGPRYTARFVTRMPQGVPEVVQRLYPFAEEGPLIYTPQGQESIGSRNGPAPSGWFTLRRKLLNELEARGLPETAPAPQQAPAAPAQPAHSGPSTVVWAALLLAGLLVLGAAAGRRAIVRRAA